MKLTVTMFEEGGPHYDGNPPTFDTEFDHVVNWEILDDYFIVHKLDGSLQAIKKYKILKFFTTI